MTPALTVSANADAVVLCSEQGSAPSLTRRLQEAIIAQLASVSILVRVERNPVTVPVTAEARLAQSDQLAARHPGDELAVYWLSGHDADDALLHIVDLQRRRVESRALATEPGSRSAAAAAAGIIAREAALAMRLPSKLSAATAKRTQGQDQGQSGVGGLAPAIGASTGPLNPDVPAARPSDGTPQAVGATTSTLTAESPWPTEPRAQETAGPQSALAGPTQPTPGGPPAASSTPQKSAAPPGAAARAEAEGASLLLSAGFYIDTAAEALAWQSGFALRALYKGPPGLPLFVAVEGSVLPTALAGEPPLQIRIKRWPIAAVAGVHLALNSAIHVQLGVGAAFEVWERETVATQTVSSSSPESERLRYGGLLHAELRLPLNPFTELMATAELGIFMNKLEYLGEAPDRFALLRSYSVSPRVVIGACLRIP